MAVNGISFARLLASSGSLKPFVFKLADHLLGPLAVPPRRNAARAIPGSPRAIAIIRPGGLGDGILALPLVRHTRRAFPGAALDVIAEQRNAGVFGLVRGELSELILYDTPSFPRELVKRRQSYDLVIDTEQWHWFSAIVAASISRGPVVGFDTRHRRSRFYTVAVPYHMDKYEGESFLDLLRAVGARCSGYPGQGHVPVPANELTRAGREAGSDAVVVQLSSSIPQRSWPREYWRELVGMLTEAGWKVILSGGRTEAGLAVMLSENAGARVLDRTGLPLAGTAAYIAAARFYIGADSGILHLAGALEKPTVALFGPGIETKWAPPGAGHVTVSTRVACSPCTLFGYTPRCKNPVCMNSISPRDVMAGVLSLSLIPSRAGGYSA